MDLTNTQRTQTKHSEGAGHDTMQEHKEIATQPTMSQSTEDAASNVLATPELFSMVLSHLEIRDLTRALCVSKYWNQTILGAIELRRTLFLAPKDSADEYLEWRRGRLEWEPFIVHGFTSSSRSVVKPHPVLRARPIPHTYMEMYKRRCLLRSVRTSAFLTRPPVSECGTEHVSPRSPCKSGYVQRFVLERTQGVTFGNVVKELAAQHARINGRLLDANGDLKDASEDQEDNFLSPVDREAYRASPAHYYTRFNAPG